MENSYRKYQEMEEEKALKEKEEYLDPQLFAQKITNLVIKEDNFYDAYEAVWTELIIQNQLVRESIGLNKS